MAKRKRNADDGEDEEEQMLPQQQQAPRKITKKNQRADKEVQFPEDREILGRIGPISI
jgi:hypothetical protein